MENASKALLIAAAVLIVIILVAFGMKVLTSPKDTIDQAQDVGESISDAGQIALGKIESSFNKGGNGEGTPEITPETISPEKSYIGYYADIDGNGSIDGIIYADLAKGGSGQWKTSDGTYSWTKETNLKNYYIIKKLENSTFGARDVIAPIENTVGNDRFYVMALTNFNAEGKTTFFWYSNFSGKSDTSEDFGSGKQNTEKMRGAWTDKKYGEGSASDIWGKIGAKVDAGWFIPSRGEWSAFFNELNITESNYTTYGIGGQEVHSYWSSSQYSKSRAWLANFNDGCMKYNYASYPRYVRLSTTF